MEQLQRQRVCSRRHIHTRRHMDKDTETYTRILTQTQRHIHTLHTHILTQTQRHIHTPHTQTCILTQTQRNIHTQAY